jgi:hypothetical protein
MSGKYKFYYNQSFFSDYTIKEDEFNSSCENEISSISIEEENELKIQITKSIISVLTELIEKNQKNINNNNLNFDDDIFNSKSIPNISTYDYMLRIVEYSNLEENTLILSLIYIDKIARIKKITKYNIYKYLITSVLIALKYNEDEIYNNNYYSQIGGINYEELMQLELNFLVLIDFNVYINNKTFEQYKSALQLLINNN